MTDSSDQHPDTKDCPLDGSCSWAALYRSSFGDFALPIQVCARCGFQAQFPPPADPDSFYDESYYTGNASYSYEDERVKEKNNAYVWDARLRNICRFVRGGRFLDVGCAFGGFLKRAEKKGFEPFGVEVSGYAAQVAKERGCAIFEGEFLSSAWPDNHFSVVTLVEVIEHLAHPKKVIQELYRITKPGGMVLIQTANFNGLQATEAGPAYHYYLPGHLSYYSDEVLSQSLLMHGFSSTKTYYGVDFPLIAKIRKTGGNPFSWKTYANWARIARYHLKSKTVRKGKPLTSSMVIYGFK